MTSVSDLIGEADVNKTETDVMQQAAGIKLYIQVQMVQNRFWFRSLKRLCAGVTSRDVSVFFKRILHCTADSLTLVFRVSTGLFVNVMNMNEGFRKQ